MEEDTVCIPPCCDDSACFVLSYCVVGCGLWNGGVGWVCGLFVSLLCLLLFSVSLVVGVRGSARAALRARTLSPNTIVFPLLLALFSLLFPAPRLSSFLAFLLSEWRWVIHHVSVCLVGMTATGSLSRSSSFFW